MIEWHVPNQSQLAAILTELCGVDVTVNRIHNFKAQGAPLEKTEQGWAVLPVLQWWCRKFAGGRMGSKGGFDEQKKHEEYLKLQLERLKAEETLIPVDLAVAWCEDFAVETKSRFSELELELESQVPGCLSNVHEILAELLRGLSESQRSLSDLGERAKSRHIATQTASPQ